MHSLLRVRISYSFILLVCIGLFLGYSRIIFFCLLAATCHELGHVAVMKRYGKKILQICIGISGTELISEPLSYRQELLCALAGPLVNLIIFLFCRWRLHYFSYCSLLLCAYNALPIYPLDGGRMLCCVLSMRHGDSKAETICEVVSFGVCLCLMLVATCVIVYYRCGLWPLFLSTVLFCKIGWTSD